MHNSKEQALKNFNDAKFGMFVTWGAYSLPAGIWKGEEIRGLGEWIMRNARIPIPEYEELTKLFNPVEFDADAWVRLAKRAGMKYLVITAKHHDGFCMFDSKQTEYDIMSTPYGKDLLKPLVDAALEETEFPPEHVVVFPRPQARAEMKEGRDLDWHEQPGAGHWWDLSDAPGAGTLAVPGRCQCRLAPFRTSAGTRRLAAF